MVSYKHLLVVCSDFYWPLTLIETLIIFGYCILCLYRLRYVLEFHNYALFISLVIIQLIICINKIYERFFKQNDVFDNKYMCDSTFLPVNITDYIKDNGDAITPDE